MSVARFASALLASSVMGLASADVLDLPIFVKEGYVCRSQPLQASSKIN